MAWFALPFATSSNDPAVGKDAAAKRLSRRIVELDALRAIAALNLLLFHYTHVYEVKYGYASPLGFEWPYGKYGVALFFMLSGFVNALAISRCRNTADFLVGRLIRVFPLYWLAVVFNIGLQQWMPPMHQPADAATIWANFTMMPNLLGYQCMEPVTWTLQIEMLFYGLLLVLHRCGLVVRPWLTWPVALAASLVSCTALQAFQGHESIFVSGLGFLSQLFVLPYLPLFVFGIALFELQNERPRRLAAVGLSLAALVVFQLIDDHGHNPVVMAGLGGLLALAAFRRLPLLRFPPLVWIGAVSYPLYLLHNNLGSVVNWQLQSLGVGSWWSFGLVLFMALAIAALFHYGFERPMGELLRGWWKWLRTRPMIGSPAADKVAAEGTTTG